MKKMIISLMVISLAMVACNKKAENQTDVTKPEVVVQKSISSAKK